MAQTSKPLLSMEEMDVFKINGDDDDDSDDGPCEELHCRMIFFS